MNELSETKERIFDVFVEMASALGYENVTTRDIAKKIGINAASIYYHFASKDKILEFAYEYYTKYQYDNRVPVSAMKKMMDASSAQELVTTLFFTFMTDDQKKYRRMILITKIIYMRLFQDPLANEIYAQSNINNAEYVTEILNYGIESGRLEKDFDVQTFADVLIGAMAIMGINAFAGADYKIGQLDQEKRILALLARLLGSAMVAAPRPV